MTPHEGIKGPYRAAGHLPPGKRAPRSMNKAKTRGARWAHRAARRAARVELRAWTVEQEDVA